jgi:hypothetical protein
MYRIELSPGEETAFRSIEELAVAIRRKVVTSRARIYHNATGKWLPIQFHPHYKLAVSMPLTQADLVAGPPVAPLTGLKLGEPASRTSSTVPSSATHEAATQAALTAWPEPKPNPPAAVKPVVPPAPKEAALSQPPIRLGTPPPEPRRMVEPARFSEPRRKVTPTRFVQQPRAEEPLRAKGSRRRRKPLRSLRVALAGAVLIACAHLLVSGMSSPNSESAARPRTPRRLVEAPAEASNDSPRTVAAVMPGLQSIPVPGLTKSSSPQPEPNAALPGSPELAPELTPADSALANPPEAEIQPAPDATNITVSVPRGAAPRAPQLVDSSGKKALKGILRTIRGSPAAEAKPPKR